MRRFLDRLVWRFAPIESGGVRVTLNGEPYTGPTLAYVARLNEPSSISPKPAGQLAIYHAYRHRLFGHVPLRWRWRLESLWIDGIRSADYCAVELDGEPVLPGLIYTPPLQRLKRQTSSPSG